MKHVQLYLVIASLFSVLSPVAAMADDGDTGGKSKNDPLPSASSAVRNRSNVVADSPFDAAGVDMSTGRGVHALKVADGVNVYADAASYAGYDTNVTQASGAEVSSMLYRVQPTVLAETQYRSNNYRFAYKGDYAEYTDYSADSVNSHALNFVAQHVFDARSSLAWGANYRNVYDPIGSTDRSVGASSPDHHHDWSANATGRYGADDAKGRVEIDAGVGGARYLNNRDTTTSADVNNLNLAARLFVRAAPKTRIVTELSRTTYDYVNDVNTLSSQDWRAQAGAVWDTTSTLTGSFKFGEQIKQYDSASRHDYKGSTWEAALRWYMLTYSSFDLVTGRALVDPTGSASGLPVTTSASLGWNHEWKSYVRSKVVVGRQRAHYNESQRVDGENRYGVSVIYDWRRWLGVGVDLAYSHRSSSVEQYNYSRMLSVLKLEASF